MHVMCFGNAYGISCYGANITCNFDAAIIYAFITLLVFVYIFFGH